MQKAFFFAAYWSSENDKEEFMMNKAAGISCVLIKV